MSAPHLEETQNHSRSHTIIIGMQMLFVAFGSLVLVPLLTGLNPAVALFTAGAGTLIFQIITRGKIPIFLASSFAFIAPITGSVQEFGIPVTLVGLMATGFVYMALSFIIRSGGQKLVNKFLPSIVIGPVIMVIGLNLAPIAINMLQGKANGEHVLPYIPSMTIGLIALCTTVFLSIRGRGIFQFLSILGGIFAGYIAAIVFTYVFNIPMISFASIHEASWFAWPQFVLPDFTSPYALAAIFLIVPVAIAPAVEHIGDMAAISNITGKNYLENPGLKNTLLGDGVATSFAAFLGGPPNTTYSEVTGAVALTRAFNPMIMVVAAFVAIGLSFIGKVSGFLWSVPTPVMGGIMIMLFGSIAVIGISTLVNMEDDIMRKRNMLIASLILIIGIGGLSIEYKAFQFGSIGLAAIVGIIAHLILPKHISIQTKKD